MSFEVKAEKPIALGGLGKVDRCRVVILAIRRRFCKGDFTDRPSWSESLGHDPCMFPAGARSLETRALDANQGAALWLADSSGIADSPTHPIPIATPYSVLTTLSRHL